MSIGRSSSVNLSVANDQFPCISRFRCSLHSVYSSSQHFLTGSRKTHWHHNSHTKKKKLQQPSVFSQKDVNPTEEPRNLLQFSWSNGIVRLPHYAARQPIEFKVAKIKSLQINWIAPQKKLANRRGEIQNPGSKHTIRSWTSWTPSCGQPCGTPETKKHRKSSHI